MDKLRALPDNAIRSVSDWRPARMFPDTYPGEAPRSSYLLWNNHVHPLRREGRSGAQEILTTHGWRDLDAVLERLGLPPLAARYPVLAYAGNRNPATLKVKLENYRYVSPSPTGDSCIPALVATLSDADVVGCALHGQGYLYGELLRNRAYTAGTVIDVHVLLLDHDQLRALNESESVRDGMYGVVAMDGVRVEGRETSLRALAYLAGGRVWMSPALNHPIAYGSINASGRNLPAMDATEMLGHAIDTLGLRAEVCRLTGLTDDRMLAQELAKFLNGQWWYQLHTARPPIAGYTRAMDLFHTRMAASMLAPTPLETDRRLSGLDAFNPGPALTWG